MKKASFKSKWALLKRLGLKRRLLMSYWSFVSVGRDVTEQNLSSQSSAAATVRLQGAAGSSLSATRHLRVKNVNESVLHH